MPISLKKGQKVDLTKSNPSLSKIVVGLGWDTNKYDGTTAFDLDASAFLLNATDKVSNDADFVFYSNLAHASGCVKHLGDNLTGEGDGDDEQLLVDLSLVPAGIQKIDFAVTIYEADERKQNFGQVSNAFIRIVNEATGEELIRYDLGEDFSIETSVVVGELYRNDNEWKFNAIGSGFQGGLYALCKNFGVNVQERITTFMGKYEILYKEAFPIVRYQLEQGEQLKAESDAMISMSNTIDVSGGVEGGFGRGLTRMLAGEKFFFQYLTANRGPGEVLFSHSLPGAIVDVELDGTYGLRIQKSGFIASTTGVDLSTKAQNLAKGLFSKEGFFILSASGKGTIFLGTYGAIHPIELAAGEEIVIDNGHLVAWPDYMQYSIEKASSGWFSSLTSGEMLVCRFKGPGTVLIQTRNPGGFAGWLSSLGFSRGN